jgi:cytochrome c oxidase subunit I
MLDRTLGEWHFWTVFIGFNATFLVMHTLGLGGMPRRIVTYGEASWGPTILFITLASFLVAISGTDLHLQPGEELANGEIAGDDPWGGNTLEWATTSPPPPYNFERIPSVRSFMPLREIQAERERRPGRRPEEDFC